MTHFKIRSLIAMIAQSSATRKETSLGKLKQFGIKLSIGSIGLIAALGLHPESAHAGAAGAEGRAQFESASVRVNGGTSCMLHPEGVTDPKQSIHVGVDEDGVARFEAVRATSPQSGIDKLTLDCTDSSGNGQSYSVDLRSDETFAPRPFDPSLTTLKLRPALSGDPQSFTQDELVSGGYGLRPDAKANPDGYARWMATARIRAHLLRSTPSRVPRTMHRSPEINAGVYDQPSNYWTGPILQGSYKKNATAALTYSYVMNEATFNVPTVTPGGLGTGTTTMTIWTGLDNVFQAIVDVEATATAVAFGIHKQNFNPWIPEGPAEGDEAGTRFTPKPGDSVFAQEWYCDATGHNDLAGGYACTYMVDLTQQVVWSCDQAQNSNCESYKLKPADLGNGKLGFWAEYIIEDDTGETVKNSLEWPDFSPVTMKGSAWVVQGSGRSGMGHAVTTATDPYVALQTDDTASTPFVRGDGHLLITLPSGGVTWDEKPTNIYYWNGKNFNNYSVACAGWIAVGPNSRGLTNGTPWTTGCHTDTAGNASVYQMQTGGAWVEMEQDVATQVAVSPEGNAWAIARNGNILYWNGSKFVENAAGGCATSIGVGPNSRGLTHGTPWMTGCGADAAGNHTVYQMQTGGKWVEMEIHVAKQVAVSPEGIAWAIAANGNILYWNGSKFVENAAGGCATSIGVGPSSSSLPNGTPWVTGCTLFADENYAVYQMQSGGAWLKLEDDVGRQIAVSPEGNAWVGSTVR
jgi:hypothetical protein